MATHSSILAWRIPWRENPGGLQSTGSQRIRHDLSDLAQHAHSLIKWLSGKNLPTKQETQARSAGREDPLAKEMATHSSILAWEIPWTEERGGLQSMGSQKSQTELSN